MFKKILCATDLNDVSSEAVKKVVHFAHQFNSQIIMLNIHEEFMTKEEMGMLRVSIDTMKSEFEKTALKAKNEMIEEIESLHAEDIQVEYIIRDGKPNKVICEQAEKAQVDLIIMGVNDKNVMTNIIFRSTASFVIEHVNIPVLVVPMKNK
jgi:nucleotide-binding universal stress UspA family protein